MSTARYFVNRTLQTVLLLWGILTFLFLLFRAMPGDPGTLMLNSGASPEAVAAARARWGLDEPIHIQYLQYVRSLATFNLGNSLTSGVPVWELVRMKIFNTFILVGPATVAFYIIGSIVGAVLGSKRGTKLESYGIIPFFVMGTMPSFFLSIILVVVFAMYLNLFPTSGMFSPGFLALHPEWPWWRPYFTQNFLHHYILPFTAVILRYVYSPLLVMRTSVTEVMGQDFTYYHRSPLEEAAQARLEARQSAGHHALPHVDAAGGQRSRADRSGVQLAGNRQPAGALHSGTGLPGRPVRLLRRRRERRARQLRRRHPVRRHRPAGQRDGRRLGRRPPLPSGSRVPRTPPRGRSDANTIFHAGLRRGPRRTCGLVRDCPLPPNYIPSCESR